MCRLPIADLPQHLENSMIGWLKEGVDWLVSAMCGTLTMPENDARSSTISPMQTECGEPTQFRFDVADMFRQLADDIDAAGSSVGVSFEIYTYDWISEGIKDHVSSSDNADDAVEAFIECCDAGLNVSMFMAVDDFEVRIGVPSERIEHTPKEKLDY